MGRIITQTSADGFSFVRGANRRNKRLSLFPGEYLMIELPDGRRELAIIEDFVGQSTRRAKETGSVSGGQYEYSCKVFPRTKLCDLVGLKVKAADAFELANFFSPASRYQLKVGEIYGRDDHIPVSLKGENLLGTHTCIFGSSRSGKSTLVGLILEEILLKMAHAQVIVFDLNSDFASFGGPRPLVEVNEARNPCTPVNGLTLQSQQDSLQALPKVFVRHPVLSLSRLSPADMLDSLELPSNPGAELLFVAVWESLNEDGVPITVSSTELRLREFINETGQLSTQLNFRVPSKADQQNAVAVLHSTLRRMDSAPIWSKERSDSLDVLFKTNKPRFIQFDLGSLPYSDRGLFSEGAFRLLWERNERERCDTFVVVDEGHNLAPASPVRSWQRRTVEWVNRISGEGRKYGLFLIIISQRPAKIHPNTLDNCRNFLVLNLQNRDDLRTLSRRTVEISEKLMRKVSTLHKHEALIFGDASHPVIIRTGRRRMK